MSKARDYSEEATRFSRQWWLNVGRNLLWIGVVTVLIWVYADMQQSDTEKVRATILLKTGTDKDLVILSEQTVDVTVQVTGSHGQLERLKKEGELKKPVIEFDVSKGRYELRKDIAIRTIDIVRDAPYFVEMGLAVTPVSPHTINLHLDRLILRELPIKLAYTGGVPADKPKFNPENASIRVAQTTWVKILKSEPKPVIKTENLELKQVQRGETVQQDLKLVASVAGERVSLITETVNVTVKVAQHTGTEKLTVNVFILTPPKWAEDGTWEKFILVRKDENEWRPTITVTGTKADLEALVGVKNKVQAYIVLNEGHKKHSDTPDTEEVQIRFPQGLRLKLVGEKLEVSFNMKERVTAPP